MCRKYEKIIGKFYKKIVIVRAIAVVIRHTAKAIPVGINTESSVHFLLPVSFFMVKIVVAQGQ